VSPFIGRLDDISTDGLALIEKLEIYDNYGYETQILALSASYYAYCELCKNRADVMTGPLSAMVC
jgi:transaldolase